jgi:hypothetical protein
MINSKEQDALILLAKKAVKWRDSGFYKKIKRRLAAIEKILSLTNAEEL